MKIIYHHNPELPEGVCYGWQERDVVHREANYTEPPLWRLKRLSIPKGDWEAYLTEWRESLNEQA